MDNNVEFMPWPDFSKFLDSVKTNGQNLDMLAIQEGFRNGSIASLLEITELPDGSL